MLGTAGRAAPDLGRVAVIGHSYGAILATAYAAVAAREEAPVPSALLLAMPACIGLPAGACDVLGNLSTIPTTTRVLIVAGADDHGFSKDPGWLWDQLGAIPAGQKNLITMTGDAHGQPPLVADHFVAVTDNWAVLDAFDWYGTWKWFDALMDCAFAGENCAYAFGDTPEQRFMGTWSDGTPIAEPRITS